MKTDDIRRGFLSFFKAKGHTIVPSDLLVPRKDPTLLFTSAGMNQFKEQFMGRNITFRRAASCQKCLRTADLDNVGRTPRHHTFFEMLGNFSFGDYFKEEAITWAWEFMTGPMGIPADKLWVSVYEDDDESYSIWRDRIKLPAARIMKLGPEDNFWPQDAPSKGPNGPCGPCSEIFYDWGAGEGCGKPSCNPSCECGRFVEVWNLVFTEFERKPDGSLESLPNKNLDTGMGLERMASVMQGVRTNFQIDLFAPVNREIRRRINKDKISDEDVCLIADHIRAAVFSIADGISPSNEKQGYVVRKLIRRAFLRGSQEKPFLYSLVPAVADAMKDVYPEVKAGAEHLSAIIEQEEKRFGYTLSTAMPILENMMTGNVKVLKDEQIFKLVDTYGLPLELIAGKASDRGISLDTGGFEKLMEQRKEQSRRGSDISCEFIFQPDRFSGAPKPDYSGDLPLEARLEFMVCAAGPVSEIKKGDCAEVITSPQSSAFYAEAGGQAGDKGFISKSGAEMEIVNTFEADGRKVLQAVVRKGCFKKGDRVTLEPDSERKRKTGLNHTATHLLQAALRNVLGGHVKQSGSFVDDKRLRFDFTHMKKLTDRELRKVEDKVNEWIKGAIPVRKEVKGLKEAKDEGALSFFGEKYGDRVKTVTVGTISMELCGGTHADNTREIELIKIVSESSIASGLRRIEALTGENARKWIRESLDRYLKDAAPSGEGGGAVLSADLRRYVTDIINGKTGINGGVARDFDLKLKPALLKAREAAGREAKKKQKKRQADAFRTVKEELDRISVGSEKIDGVNFVSGVLKDADMTLLRKAAAYLAGKIASGVVVLGGEKENKAYLICTVSRDIADKGVEADKIIAGIADNISGGGGGKAVFAQAGGKRPEGLAAAVEAARSFIRGRG